MSWRVGSFDALIVPHPTNSSRDKNEAEIITA